ncbi:MAG TPA: UDP-3-O-acyl-N-acetylglucosamine deacetylase [Elusimicrobiota bacterium]|nr:UDP-3-O-acyl-N-acetylglucosamine deacetylase [Elusimicrobiota bacterium]
MPLVPSQEPQRTIGKEAVYKGVGLHTGNRCHLVFKPAPEDSGIVFVRSDLPGKPRLPASYRIVSSVIRGTTLSLGGEKDHEARVHTVEHVLAALSGLGIDNLAIEVNANEPPVADGSARPFIETLRAAGVRDQNKHRTYLRPDPFVYKGGETEYRVEPADELVLETTIEFKHPLIQRQNYVFHFSTDAFVREISPARTFCFDYEVEALKRQGLARGGSLDNAVVVGMDKIHNKEKALRFPDEFVRHKTLDLLGDLSLLGYPLLAKITTVRPGHGYNVNLVKQLAAQLETAAINR